MQMVEYHYWNQLGNEGGGEERGVSRPPPPPPTHTLAVCIRNTLCADDFALAFYSFSKEIIICSDEGCCKVRTNWQQWTRPLSLMLEMLDQWVEIRIWLYNQTATPLSGCGVGQWQSCVSKLSGFLGSLKRFQIQTLASWLCCQIEELEQKLPTSGYLVYSYLCTRVPIYLSLNKSAGATLLYSLSVQHHTLPSLQRQKYLPAPSLLPIFGAYHAVIETKCCVQSLR
jgi:hypothetical protein